MAPSPASSVLKSDVVVLARIITTSLSASRELLTRGRSTHAETRNSLHTRAIQPVRPATPTPLLPMWAMILTMRTLPTTSSKKPSTLLESCLATHLPRRPSQLVMPRPRRSTDILPTSTHYQQQMSRQPLRLHLSSLTALHLARNAQANPSAPVTTLLASRQSTANPSSSRRTNVYLQQQPLRHTASTNKTTSRRTQLTLLRAPSWVRKTCSSSTLACTAVLATRCSMLAWTHGSRVIEDRHEGFTMTGYRTCV